MDINERKEDIFSIHHVDFRIQCQEMEITAKCICWDIFRLHGETSLPQRKKRFPIHTGSLISKYYDSPHFIMMPNYNSRKNGLGDKIFFHTRDMEFGLQTYEYMTITEGPFSTKNPQFILGIDENYAVEWYISVQKTINKLIYEWREPFNYVRILTGEDRIEHVETNPI